jgi:DNA polymerase-3 subunit epsilon
MMTACRDMISGIFSRKNDALGVPVNEAGFVVVDTELTGLEVKKNSIISIGAVKMKGTRIDLGNVFYRLINPSTAIDHRGIVVHGITPSDVAEEPPVEHVLSEFLEFCGDDIIVGHFISLDMDFINREVKRSRGSFLKNSVVDTCRLYEWIKSGDGSFSRHYDGNSGELDLVSLAREYGVPVSDAHNALGDAFITAQLFQRFMGVLAGLGVKTARDLVRVGRP